MIDFSFMRLRILFLFLIMVIACRIQAQTYSHASVWSRILISKQFNKISVSTDVAYRRQNDFRISKMNFLNSPLLDAQRITVGYRRGNWLYSFALSRWHSYPLLGNAADFLRKATVEWRYTPGIEWFKKIGKGTLQCRTQYEYRTFTDRTTGRLRERFQYRYPITNSNDLVFLQEFLLGVPPNSSKKYEQNQMGITFNHAFGKHIESELGYRYIYRKRRLTDETDNENALVAGLLLRF